jgi:hypothetical protein
MALLWWVVAVLCAVALILAALLAALFFRRGALQRDGGFDMCVQTGSRDGWAGGWVFGIGRYRGDGLEWFRTFSVNLRPKRCWRRAETSVIGRRRPEIEEAYELPAGHVVLTCVVGSDGVEVSMTEAAATAFLAWLEAAPPGGHLVR